MYKPMRTLVVLTFGTALLGLTACQSGPKPETVQKITDEFASWQTPSYSGSWEAYEQKIREAIGEEGLKKLQKDAEAPKKWQALKDKFEAAKKEIEPALMTAESAKNEAKAFVDGLAQEKRSDEEISKAWTEVSEKWQSARSALQAKIEAAQAVESEISAFIEEATQKFAQKTAKK
ncbi:MAG: hypothetical protein ACUVRD_00115 [Bacteroidia bacterium]